MMDNTQTLNILMSPTEKPNASGFLWNKKMMLNMNCRGYANAQFMQPEPSKYAFSPSLEAKTFMQPEHPYFAHHPGRFFYIKDEDSGDIFSVPFAPCNKQFDSFRFTANEDSIEWAVVCNDISVVLHVSLADDAPYEQWRIALKNVKAAEQTSEKNRLRARRFSVYSYFPLGYMSWMNQSATFDTASQSIVAAYVTPYQKVADYAQLKNTAQCTFLTSDITPEAWCANQSAFEGELGLQNPAGIKSVLLGGQNAFYETPTAVLQHRIELIATESKSISYLFGACHHADEIPKIKTLYRQRGKTKESATRTPGHLRIQTCDRKFDEFINTWLPRQVFYHGDVNRLTTDPQTRNYIQDNIGMCFIQAESARTCLLTALSQQHLSGEMPDGILLHEDAELKYINQIPHSDHCIWLPLLLEVYLDQSNDTDLLSQLVRFNDSSEERTVAQHIELALNWVLSKRDARGLCYIEQGDWCDPMNMVGYKGKGVSAWLSLALASAIKVWLRLVKDYNIASSVDVYQCELDALQHAVIEHCWDGNWFARGITDDNAVFGVSDDNEGKIFLNPQSWALLAGIDSPEYKQKLIEAVDEHLQTPFGNQMLAPAYTQMDERIGRVTQKFPGSAENGSVYNHAFAFWIYAMFESGEPHKAYLCLREMIDAGRSEDAGQLPIFIPNYYRGAYKQFPEVAGKSSHLFNTGTAAWIYRIVIEQMFGLKGNGPDLYIKPCIPEEMTGANVFYQFRGASIELEIDYTEINEPSMVVNGLESAFGVIQNIAAGENYHVSIRLPKQARRKTAQLLLICGVSGSGKSTLAKYLAQNTGAVLVEGDDYHSVSAKMKMNQGIALDEHDRGPWINRLQQVCAQKLRHGYQVVLCYSGLKETHRAALLSLHNNAKLVMLNPTKEILEKRLAQRSSHFFDPALLSSQLNTVSLPPKNSQQMVIDENLSLLELSDRIQQFVEQ